MRLSPFKRWFNCPLCFRSGAHRLHPWLGSRQALTGSTGTVQYWVHLLSVLPNFCTVLYTPVFRIRIFSISDPGTKYFPSRIRNKEFKHFYPKIVSKLSEIWSGLFIPDPGSGIFTHPGSGSATLEHSLLTVVYNSYTLAHTVNITIPSQHTPPPSSFHQLTWTHTTTWTGDCATFTATRKNK